MNFVRAFPFYLRLGSEAYSFKVVIAAYKELDPRTGMSVNLITLNQVAEKVLAQKPKSSKLDLQAELQNRVNVLRSKLKKSKTDLVSVQFDEVRGYSIVFEKEEVLLVRRDFATDKNGDLFSVTSYFNQNQSLKRMTLTNLKLGLEEMFVY